LPVNPTLASFGSANKRQEYGFTEIMVRASLVRLAKLSQGMQCGMFPERRTEKTKQKCRQLLERSPRKEKYMEWYAYDLP
jgi:hypothetical protein